MTFYIPEFWCGVMTTIIIEFIILIVIAVYRKDKNDGDKEK